MANIDRAYSVDILALGDFDDDQTLITQGAIDPSSAGYEAPVGSLFMRRDVPGTYLKTGVLDTDWELLASDTKVSNLTNSLGSAINADGTWNGFSGTSNLDGATDLTDALTILDSTGGGGSLTIQEEGVALGGFTTINFIGTSVTATDAGGGVTNVTVTGGTGAPAPPDTSVQYNSGGAFGGDANFTYDDVADRVFIGGAEGANHEVTYAGAGNLQIADRDEAVSYIQVDGDATYEAFRAKFQRSTPGISGWITMYYDQAAPSLRMTDEDDDAPYISFDTIASGTYDLPEYLSLFGARGAVGTRDPATDVNGFAWLIGNNTTPEALYAGGTYDPAMELDQQWLRIPVGTTAERPVTPVEGMIRYNSDVPEFEGYENGAWVPLVSRLKESFHAYNAAVTQVLTTTFVTAVIGTDIRSDASFVNDGLGTITVNKTGNFRITYDIGADSTGPRSSMECKLQVNTVDVPGTFSYGYHRNTGNGEDTASCTTLVSLTSGDAVRVQIREIAGAIVTLANACRLTIEEID